MEKRELIKRLEDLAELCSKRSEVTATHFLTPEELYEAEHELKQSRFGTYVADGGGLNCERKMIFFLPEWLESDYFDAGEFIAAVKFKAFFGEPGHRDYLGAMMGRGITRDSVGDIMVAGQDTYVFCRKTVSDDICSMDSVGRFTVRGQKVELAEVPVMERKTKSTSFTVMSPRLDAVISGIFNISRGDACELIKSERVEVNYKTAVKNDMQINAGDIISARGLGKAEVKAFGGISKRGRQFINAEIYC